VIAWKKKTYVHGVYLPKSEIDKLAHGTTPIGWRGEGIWKLGH